MVLMDPAYIEDSTKTSIGVFEGVTILNSHCYGLLTFNSLAAIPYTDILKDLRTQTTSP
jgi:hypothetical protein